MREFHERIRAARERANEAMTATGDQGRPPPRGTKLRMQRSAARIGEISLQLANPLAVARSASERRLHTGGVLVARAGSSRALPVNAAVVKSGWGTKLLPSHVAISQRRFFVLYDDHSFCFYDREMDPPAAATCHGKVHLSKVERFVKSGSKHGVRYRTGRGADEYGFGDRVWTLKMAGSRLADWDLGFASEGEGESWESALEAAIETAKTPVAVVAAMPVTAGAAAVSSAAVVAAEAVDSPA